MNLTSDNNYSVLISIQITCLYHGQETIHTGTKEIYRNHVATHLVIISISNCWYHKGKRIVGWFDVENYWIGRFQWSLMMKQEAGSYWIVAG